MKLKILQFFLSSLALLAFASVQAQQINIICSVQAEWCNMISTVYSRTTGVKVNMSLKGLSLEYKSPSLPQLHAWAQQQAQQSVFKTVGIYSGPLGFGYNTELLTKKNYPSPKPGTIYSTPHSKAKFKWPIPLQA